MTRMQHPLKTGFSPFSTAADVLAGVDLTGYNIIVTAGHSRLGREVTRTLAGAGARVTVASRDPRQAASVVGSIPGVEIERLDLAVPDSIKSFAARWAASARPLHALVNNAAMLFSHTRQLDARGNELSFSISHLGHFHLTQLLLPALRAAGSSRVLTVTSGAARFGGIRWDDLAFSSGYDASAAYTQSKRANVLFTVELDRLHAREGIRALAAHPGVVIGSGPFDAATQESYRRQGLLDDHGAAIIDPVNGKKTIEQGAATLVLGAASPLLEGFGGVYLKDSDIAILDDTLGPVTPGSIPSDANSAMLDADDAKRLWGVSHTLTL